MQTVSIGAAFGLALGIGVASVTGASALSEPRCGYYKILGCFQDYRDARDRLDFVGGPAAGGGAGIEVVDTNRFPNFDDGWYCVADGPYDTRARAERVAWKEFIPDAYVKNAC